MVLPANSVASASKGRRAWPVDSVVVPLLDGAPLLIRPAQPDDAASEAEFLARLSDEMRAFCFLGLMRDTDDGTSEFSKVASGSEVRLLGFVRVDGADLQVGTARFCASKDGSRCDCAVAVDPAWQGHGVGSALMRHLIHQARRRGIRHMYSFDAAHCSKTHWLAENLGFRRRIDPEDPQTVTFELTLRD